MQVVEKQHHRPAGRRAQRCPHSLEQPKARGIGDLARGLRRLGDPQLGQEPRQLLPREGRDRARAPHGHVLAQRLNERLVWGQRLLLTAAEQHRDTF